MLNNTLIQKIQNPRADIQGISVSVLRLDLIHPVVSGNKLFKLKYYIDAALKKEQQLITFGGPYSNHLVATAFAAQQAGLKVTGYVRGETPTALSNTLQDCITYGMDLRFVARSEYDQLQEVLQQEDKTDMLVVPYGGYGRLGAMGAKEILEFEEASQFDIILASCGSGTMAAGLLASLHLHQQLLLVSSVKNNFSIEEEIKALLTEEEYANKTFEINHEYHFGGFAKKDETLLSYMNEFYRETGIPTDIVYTGKLAFAMNDLLKKTKLPSNSNILFIHSGGLQGNRSLKNNELIF
jgi:1-aminocyclopropane-1-carboxylate deaminase/D-cysteine desulfhydrase-like pyridoxal-dependent ACC family enzyme